MPRSLPLLVLALAGCAASAFAAGTPAPFSLRDALADTLAHNPALRIQQSVIEQKSGIENQFSGAFDWNSFANLSYTRALTPMPGLPGTSPVDSSHTTAYTAGLTRLFRNGISLSPTVNVGVTQYLSPASPTYGTSQLALQIVVPLLRGLGRDSTGAAEAAARGDVEVARLLYQHALSLQAFTTAADYWASRSADDTLAVQRSVELSAERLVESTKALVSSGVFPPAYLLQAEANLREKRTVRINAELDARSARLALGQSLGLAPEAISATPAPSDEFPALPPPLAPLDDQTRSALIVRALHQRCDYRAVQESLVPLKILTRQAELDLKPQVNLTGSAGYQGLNAGSSEVAPLGQRLTGLNAEVGLAIAWPMANTYQRGLFREKRANEAQVEAQTVQLSQTVAGDVLLAIEQLRLRADAVRSADETVQIAAKAVDAQYKQLKAGECSILDVINLENLLSQARISLISARASYAVSIAQVRYALGAVFADAPSGLTLNDLAAPPALRPAP